MPTVRAEQLKSYAAAIFAAAGATPGEAEIVADHLVDANLAGHDSHGVMRLPLYVQLMEKGAVASGVELEVVLDTPGFALVDGHWGFGQVMGRRATELAMERARKSVAFTISGRNCNHLGRLGEYPQIAASEGFASFVFINTHGYGRLVAPFGGIERRLSANPIAGGIPRANGDPLVLDMSTCMIAEGKIRNFHTAGQPVPAGCIIDAEGNPTTDAGKFYGPPEGALLPIAGHKGFGLGVMGDILAGAISGAGCSRPEADRIGNSFLMTVIDVEQARGRGDFEGDVDNLVDYVKSSKLAQGFDEILMPGEPEDRSRARRRSAGIPIHERTWTAIHETGARYSVEAPELA